MGNILSILLASLVQSPQVQQFVMSEITKLIPSGGGILSELMSLFMRTTAPSTGDTVAVQTGPSQTVKNIQHALNVAGLANPPLVEDGHLGPKTEAAMKAVAAKLGITV